jgi:hypothetical protein
VRRWTSGLLAALLLVLAGWVLAPTASACSCTGDDGRPRPRRRRGDLRPAGRPRGGRRTALHVFAVDAVDDRLVADLCGGTTVWTPQAASEVQMLTGVSVPEPGSAGTELPGGPSDTALEAVVAVLLVAAFAGGLVLRRRAGG